MSLKKIISALLFAILVVFAGMTCGCVKSFV